MSLQNWSSNQEHCAKQWQSSSCPASLLQAICYGSGSRTMCLMQQGLFYSGRVCQHFLMWSNFPIESSPFKQVPSLGLFPCSFGWLFIGGESSLRFWKPQKAAVASCWCLLMHFSSVAWFHLPAALFLPHTAVLCCAELQSHGRAGRAGSSTDWQDLCHSKGNVH